MLGARSSNTHFFACNADTTQCYGSVRASKDISNVALKELEEEEKELDFSKWETCRRMRWQFSRASMTSSLHSISPHYSWQMSCRPVAIVQVFCAHEVPHCDSQSVRFAHGDTVVVNLPLLKRRARASVSFMAVARPVGTARWSRIIGCASSVTRRFALNG